MDPDERQALHYRIIHSKKTAVVIAVHSSSETEEEESSQDMEPDNIEPEQYLQQKDEELQRMSSTRSTQESEFDARSAAQGHRMQCSYMPDSQFHPEMQCSQMPQASQLCPEAHDFDPDEVVFTGEYNPPCEERDVTPDDEPVDEQDEAWSPEQTPCSSEPPLKRMRDLSSAAIAELQNAKGYEESTPEEKVRNPNCSICFAPYPRKKCLNCARVACSCCTTEDICGQCTKLSPERDAPVAKGKAAGSQESQLPWPVNIAAVDASHVKIKTETKHTYSCIHI